MTIKSHHTLLMTGAAGGLGQAMRARLNANCDVLRLSDIGAMAPAQAGEEVVQADLADAAAVNQGDIARRRQSLAGAQERGLFKRSIMAGDNPNPLGMGTGIGIAVVVDGQGSDSGAACGLGQHARRAADEEQTRRQNAGSGLGCIGFRQDSW